MKNLYDILAICVIFFLIIIIYHNLKYEYKIIEGLSQADMDVCRDNNTTIRNTSKEQKDILGKIKYVKKNLKMTIKNMKNDKTKIDDLMKKAEKKINKTGAKAN